MAEEVTRIVENVDKMFPQIVLNGEVHNSTRYKKTSSSPSTPQTTPSQQSVLGEDIYGVELNNILHNIVDKAIHQELADEVSARQDADSALQNSIDGIEDVIPSSASSSNKLADSASVENSITDAINDLDVSVEGGNGKYIKSISQVNGKIVAESDWLSATGGGVAFVGTRAQYETAKIIPLGQTGHIPSGALVIITDEDDYLNSEDR